MRIGLRTLVVGGSLAVLMATCAQAQETTQDITEPNVIDERAFGFSNVTYSFSPYASYLPNAGARDASGSVTITRGGADLSASFMANDRTFVVLSLRGEHANYNFEPDAGLPEGQLPPLSAANESNASVFVNHVLDDTWTVIGGAQANLAWENGADLGDAITFTGVAGFQYRLNQNISVGAGIVVANRLEGATKVFPVPFIEANYPIDAQWGFTANTIDGAELTFAPADQDVWRVRFGLGWEFSEYRLDDGDPHTVFSGGGGGPQQSTFVQGTAPDGVLSEIRVPLSATILWDVAPGWEAQIGVAANVLHRFNVDDHNGRKIAEENYGIAPELKIGVTGRF